MRFIFRAVISLLLALVVGAVAALMIAEYYAQIAGELGFALFATVTLISFIVFFKWPTLSFAFRGFVVFLAACGASYATAAIITSYYESDSNFSYYISYGLMVNIPIAAIAPLISRKNLGTNLMDSGGYIPMLIAVIYVIILAVNNQDYRPMDYPLMDSVYGIIQGLAMFYLPMVPFSIALGLMYFGSFVREHPKMRSWLSFGRGGAARWAGPYSLNTNYRMDGKGGIFLGATMFLDTIVKYKVSMLANDDAHHVTVAQSGAGKSVTALWPNLKTNNSPMIIIDPKGEHADFSAGFRSDSYVLDPFRRSNLAKQGPSMITDYNPLSEIDVHADGARGLVQAISNACVMEDNSKDPHFPEAAKTVIEGVICHVLTRLPPKEQTLPKVAEMFQGFDPVLGVSDPHAFDDIITDMSTNDACGKLPMFAASVLVRAADRERGSILTTCFRSLKWVTDPPMERHLSKHSTHLLTHVVRASGKTSLYIVLPFEYMQEDSQIRWMRMMINLINVHMFRSPRGSDQSKLLFVLDEFPRLGYMKSLEDGIVTARGAGMKYWILLQNIGQLKSTYGDSWESFLSSANVQAFGISDSQTADWISNATGDVKNEDSGSNPLMKPSEVREFLGKEEPTQIIIPVTGLPVRLERLGFKRIKKYQSMG